MTIEQIVECSAEQLEKMSDEELLEHFKKYLDVTRPERITRKQTTMYQEPVAPVSIEKKNALLKAEELGIDMSFMFQKRKKK